MLRKRVGTILVGIGSALIISGAAFSLTGGSTDSGDRIASAAKVTTTVPSTTAPAESATTAPATGPPATTTAPTAAPPIITTFPATTVPPVATTIPPADAVAAFISEFGTAIANEDIDWLFSHLHPSMSLEYGEDVCRGFIAQDILALTQYALTGSVTGPDTKTFSTGVADLTISNIYTAETRFVFQGQEFDARADFVYEDTVTWLAVCR